jgi:hypothetical protein
MAPDYLAMFLFLLVGTCVNLPFLYRSMMDLRRHSELRQSLPSAPPALFTVALSEFCWVVPCLIQCAITLFNGTAGEWSPMMPLGCDIMGFYSVFASVSGMMSTLWVACLTYRSARGTNSVTTRTSAIVCVCTILGSAIFSALPFFGVGAFAYTGEGFCYLDWYSKALSALMLVLLLPAIITTLTYLILVATRGGWPSQTDLILMAVGFLSAWTLWVPACIIGLAGAAFPQHFMIAGTSQPYLTTRPHNLTTYLTTLPHNPTSQPYLTTLPHNPTRWNHGPRASARQPVCVRHPLEAIGASACRCDRRQPA